MPIARHTPIFERGDVVKVPFPYTDRSTRQHRPAVVVSGADLGERHGLAWVLMITSAANRAWPGDIPIRNLQRAGLPAASIVRTAKIATIEATEASKLGTIGRKELDRVMAMIALTLEEHRP